MKITERKLQNGWSATSLQAFFFISSQSLLSLFTPHLLLRPTDTGSSIYLQDSGFVTLAFSYTFAFRSGKLVTLACKHVKWPRARIGLDWPQSHILHFTGKAQLGLFLTRQEIKYSNPRVSLAVSFQTFPNSSPHIGLKSTGNNSPSR